MNDLNAVMHDTVKDMGTHSGACRALTNCLQDLLLQ
jgi:hypothetical protein